MALLDAKVRGLSLTEVLALQHLPDDGLVFEEPLDPAWVDAKLGIDQGLTGFHCEPGPNARLEVQPMGPMATRPPILVRGKASANLRSTCVRCLAEVVLNVSVRIEQLLVPESAATEDKGEEPNHEALDEGAYSHEGVDLPNVLREAILLELAMNPTCSDEAACDVRTEKLIEDVNAKNRAPQDPRWAPLKDLLKGN